MFKFKKHHDLGFLLIALFKVVKGVLLLIVGIGALSLLNQDFAVFMKDRAHLLQIDLDSRLLQEVVSRIGGLDRHDIELVAGTTLFYSVLLLTEGIGLLFEKVWAEYMTFAITASFIPYEGFKLTGHILSNLDPDAPIHYHRIPTLLALFIINILAAAYVAWRLHQRALVIRHTKHEALVATAAP